MFNFSLFNLKAVKCNLDPSKIAGPLETAFQDIVGQTFLLGVGYAILSSFEVIEDADICVQNCQKVKPIYSSYRRFFYPRILVYHSTMIAGSDAREGGEVSREWSCYVLRLLLL